jgi:hypothetical protein
MNFSASTGGRSRGLETRGGVLFEAERGWTPPFSSYRATDRRPTSEPYPVASERQPERTFRSQEAG